jgi:DNA-binding FadR family transcriptional regulator
MEAGFSLVGERDDARRRSACMIGAETPTGNRAHEAVFSVEMNLLERSWPVGESLGSLPDVQKALGIGRPACREAITILEARGVLESRRGPGGGLFVRAPTLEDVVGATLMYLALTGATQDCVPEFRRVVWRMVVAAAIQRPLPIQPANAQLSEWGFAVDLAERLGNGAMKVAAQLAEMLARICQEPAAPARDAQIDAALLSHDVQAAWSRVDVLAQSNGLNPPMFGLELAEQGLSLSGRKSAMALAARMAREFRDGRGAVEAEWETAERLGYTDAVVRQARRILQDFDIVRCRRGRKGAEWAPPANAEGVIRLLAPCLAAGGLPAHDNSEVAGFLASSAPVLAARRVAQHGRDSIKLFTPLAPTHIVDVMQGENMLLDLSGNPLLVIMVRSLGLANVFVDGVPPAWPTATDIMGFNRRIMQAIKAGDPGAAADVAWAKWRLIQESARPAPTSPEAPIVASTSFTMPGFSRRQAARRVG